jgi:hypothetical protein
LDYYLESYNFNGSSTFWVVVPIQGTTELFMIYGNSNANSESTGTVGSNDNQPILTFNSEINLRSGTYSETGLIAYYNFDNITQETENLISINNNLNNNTNNTTSNPNTYTFNNSDDTISTTLTLGSIGSANPYDASTNRIVLNTSANNLNGNFMYLNSTSVSNLNGKTLYISFIQTNNTNDW